MIYRIRVRKNRYGVSHGRSFIGFHIGKRSLYLAKGKFPVKISDVRGWEQITAKGAKA